MANIVLHALLAVMVSGCSLTRSFDSPAVGERAGTRVWALRELNGRRVPAARREAATVQLAVDHTVRGSAACNHVGGEEIRWAGEPQDRKGTFHRDAAGATITTAMGCADASGMMLGNRFWQRMVHAATWSIQGRTLTIRFDDGSSALLELASAPPR